MCRHDLADFSRRTVLGGLSTGLGTAVLAGVAGAAPFACFDPTVLAARPGEKSVHSPSRADGFVMPAPAKPTPPIGGALAGIIRRVDLPAGDKAVALTFDLCQTRSPIAGYDGAIVDYLRANRIPATFFPAGRWLETHRDRAAQLAADPLFELGNHSFDHPDLHAASADRIQNEILLTEAALAATRTTAATACATIAEPAQRLFRFPYGSCAEAGAAAANAVGSVVIQWDVVSGDPDGTSAATITTNVMRGVQPGSIVVMHANGRGTHTAEALARIVPALRAEGFTLVTVSALLAAGRPAAATACYINRPGDTLRYDNRIAHHPPTEARGRYSTT